jgi:GxxExxY protein
MIDEGDDLNLITGKIIPAAIEVHKSLGPGLLESAYQARTAFELIQSGLKVEQQKPLPVIYKGMQLDAGYRLDMVINDAGIVELKSVASIEPIHEAQLLSYLKLSGLKVGLLINFNVKFLKNGIRRIVNNFPDNPSTERIPHKTPRSPRAQR